MTDRATVTTTDQVVGGVTLQRIIIDCPHGTTTGDLIASPSEVDVIRIRAARHEAAEGCGCALPLLADGVRA